jgi:hypothetical protein
LCLKKRSVRILVDHFRLARPIHGAQQASVPIIIKQRPRLLVVSRQSRTHGFRVVIRTLHQFSFGMQIANIIVARRLEIDVVDFVANRTIPPSGHALLQQIERHVDQHRNDRLFLFLRELIQTLRLRRRARKTVEDVTVFAIVLGGAFLHELNGQLIGHQMPARHDIPDFLRQRRLRVPERPEDISGRNLR